MTSLPLLQCQQILPVLIEHVYDLSSSHDHMWGVWKGCMTFGLNTSIWQTTHSNSTNMLTCLMKLVDELVDPWAVLLGVSHQVQGVIW